MAFAATFRVQTNNSVPHISGPNCWNQALMSVSLLEVPRFTSDEEFVYLLKKHCEQVQNPSYGSLGRMSDKEGEVHAFIWVSESEVYAKNSMGALELPRQMPVQEMLDTYLRHDECIPTSTLPVCFRQTTYYNCKELSPDVRTQQAELKILDSILNRIVYAPETMSRPRHSCDADFIESRFVKIQSLIEEIKTFKLSGLITEAEYLKTWVISATEQIDEIEFSTHSEFCLSSDKNFQNKYKLFEEARQNLNSLIF